MDPIDKTIEWAPNRIPTRDDWMKLTSMNRTRNQGFGCRTFLILVLTGSGLAQSGCQSTQPKTSAAGGAATPGNLQAADHQPLPYHIDADMRPVTTSNVVAQYDVALLQAVAQRWYRLLDTLPGARAKGKVVVEFYIPPDGKVAEARISESTVDKSLALICQKAVLDASPFAPWTPEMRQALPNDLRTATFTFSFH